MKKFLIVFGISAFLIACNSSEDQKPAEEKKDTVAHLQIDCSELNGAASPINCARKIPGPLIVCI